jgi:hypothetical protein
MGVVLGAFGGKVKRQDLPKPGCLCEPIAQPSRSLLEIVILQCNINGASQQDSIGREHA